ncbi:MAG: hypothetical protein DRN96_10075 [Thermoproteota archaeon]|nr:MAG: hypothetical protein DRN96_10075 [Candidatus Korarchaeota archaeon]
MLLSLRVIHFTSVYPRFHGDVHGWFIEELCRQLAELGCEVHVLCPHDGSSPLVEESHGVMVHRFTYLLSRRGNKLTYRAGMKDNVSLAASGVAAILAAAQLPSYLRAAASSLRKLIRKLTPDLVNAHWTVPQGLISALEHPNTVITEHGLEFKGRVLGVSLAPLAKVAFQRARVVVVNSRYMREQVKKLTSTPVVTIRMGVKPPRVEPRGSEPVVLACGFLIPRKGFHHLVAAFSIVKRELKDAQLVIVGEGPMMESLRSLARRLGVEGAVHLVGKLTWRQLWSEYLRCAVFAHPALEEGLGLVIAEAMSAGKPVVAYDSGGPRDLIVDGVTGFLVPPGDILGLADRIRVLLEDPRLAREMGARGRELIQRRMSFKLIARMYVRVYRAVLAHVGCRQLPQPVRL